MQKCFKICTKYAKKLFSIKCRHFTRNNLLLLILRVLISLIKQFFTLHSNRVKCKMCLICRKILWKYFYISLGLVRSLPWGPRGLAVRRLLQMQEVVGSNRTESKVCFLHFTLWKWNLNNCFVKLIKTLKIKKNYC